MRHSLITELLVRSSLNFDGQAELRNIRSFVSSKMGPVSLILTSYFKRSLVRANRVRITADLEGESLVYQTARSRVNTSRQNRRHRDTLQAMTKPYHIRSSPIPVNPQSHPTTACISSRIWFSISALTPSHPRISYLCDHALEEGGRKDGC